ncbi:MAG TPA: MscL family protein [Actinomycetota bacterium]
MLALAFNAVVLALIDGVVMPLIAAAVGEPNFDELTFTVGEGVIRYGSFLTALVNFLVIAFVPFLIVKGDQRAARSGEEEAVVRGCPFCTTDIPVAATRCPSCTSQVEPLAT